MMRNLVVELHGSVLAILLVLPAAAVFLKTTPSLEITAPHCCSTVKVECFNCQGYNIWGYYELSYGGDICPSWYYRSLEDASCPQNVEEGWAYYSEHDSGWRVTCELPPRPNPTPPPTNTSPTPPPDPWSTFGGLTNVEVFIGMFVICALAMVCLCSCKRRAEDDTESLFQVDGGEDNVAYEPPPPPSYTPPRQPKSDGPPSYDEAVNMA